jgi:hypothetical protein
MIDDHEKLNNFYEEKHRYNGTTAKDYNDGYVFLHTPENVNKKEESKCPIYSYKITNLD